MLDHVAIRVSDRAASERFYRTVLEPIEAWPPGDLRIDDATPERPPTRALHIGFVAPSREQVDAFWRTGTAAGYEDDGAPGERPEYTPDYYGAFLRDPDGNSVEAVHHDDVRRGGRIDHLWIGVRDLERAAAFYRGIARLAGLRQGREWDEGRQFRGAWATFSLLADGRPPTENLKLAFPAPDRRTADEAGPLVDPDGTEVELVWRGP
jgi:catechol 2,3-dioxygenase-like lactoylglutathione lyase family enzyme